MSFFTHFISIWPYSSSNVYKYIRVIYAKKITQSKYNICLNTTYE